MVLPFVFQFYPVSNFGKFSNFALGTVRSEREDFVWCGLCIISTKPMCASAGHGTRKLEYLCCVLRQNTNSRRASFFWVYNQCFSQSFSWGVGGGS